jgi:hypothetical protein
MSADQKNASSLFSNVRRSRGHEVAIAGAVLLAAYFGVASVLINTYQQPDVPAATARV